MTDNEGPFGPPTPEWTDSLRHAAAAFERADTQNRENGHARAFNFLQTVAANLDNAGLTDEQFRDFIRDSLDDMPGIGYLKP